MRHSLRVRLLLAAILVIISAVSVSTLVAGRWTSGEFRRYIAHGGAMRHHRYATCWATLMPCATPGKVSRRRSNNSGR